MRKNRIPRVYIPKGVDQQGRLQDGQYEDLWQPDPLWWVNEALICAALAAVVLFLLAIGGLVL